MILTRVETDASVLPIPALPASHSLSNDYLLNLELFVSLKADEHRENTPSPAIWDFPSLQNNLYCKSSHE